MPLGLVDFFEVGIVGDILDPLLQRDDLVPSVPTMVRHLPPGV
jgi:hypothetical protein